MFKKIFSAFALWLVFCLQSVYPALAEEKSPLEFLVVPVEKETAMFRRFLPVKNCLQKHLGRPVSLKLGQIGRAHV